MRKSLYCNRCHTRLSVPLTIVSGKDPSVRQPEVLDRHPLIPRGTAFKAWQPVPWIYTESGDPLHFSPQYWLDPEDLTNLVRETRNARRLGGCCGVAGSSGPNMVCQCGVEIGTRQTDCWTPRVFIPAPEATEWIEEN